MSADSSRRRFLEGATAAGSLLAAKTVLLEPAAVAHAPGPTPASDRVRFGMVGIGMQGSTLCCAIPSRFPASSAPARPISGTAATRSPARSPTTPALPVSRRYQDLLARADIDCIVAAVPDHWHKRVVVDACNAGKDIYCEKPMSHAASEGFEMVEAARKNSRIVQIGSQRVSSALCAKARELYRNGAIGEVEMVELTLGRNDPTGAWVYPPPLGPLAANWIGTPG
jgi:predicted dehydrogenase